MASPTTRSEEPDAGLRPLPNGPAAAAVLAGGIGSVVLGIAIMLVELSGGIKNLLNWWNPAGPLTGKTGVAVVAFLLSWALLARLWRGKDVNFPRVAVWSLVLVALGLLLTFPPIFLSFGH